MIWAVDVLVLLACVVQMHASEGSEVISRQLPKLSDVDLERTMLGKQPPIRSALQGPSATSKVHAFPARTRELRCSTFHQTNKRVALLPLVGKKLLSQQTNTHGLQNPFQLRKSSVPGPRQAVTVNATSISASPTRPPYALTGNARPTFRGKYYMWLHRTGAWYFLSGAYMSVIGLFSDLSLPEIGLRAVVSLATSLNVWLSDGYHNSDLRGPGALSRENELKWIRGDFLGISLVQNAHLWLWSSNVGWIASLKAVGIVSGMTTGLVGMMSLAAVPKNRFYVLVQVCTAFQFLGLSGYLIWTILSSQPLAITTLMSTLIFGIYAPGLLLYALKWPKRADFGYHEIFHTSVLSGHLASMGFDIAHNVVN